MLDETGVAGPSYPTLNRRLPVFANAGFRQALSKACADHAALGPASLVLYDVSTLYFETDAGDGFREPGFSKERRLEPQITLGLLTDASGFPLTVAAFEGNKAKTATMVPVINATKRTTRAFLVSQRAGLMHWRVEKIIVRITEVFDQMSVASPFRKVLTGGGADIFGPRMEVPNASRSKIFRVSTRPSIQAIRLN